MLTIVPPSKFTLIPWKNGLGKTVEMAISEGGSVEQFDWRISQATVSNDGEFSDFSGIERNLVLINGKGLTLSHYDRQSKTACQQDTLSNLLDYANFDGGYQTIGKLENGAIVDLNIMTNASKYHVHVITVQHAEDLVLPKGQLVFMYSLAAGLKINYLDRQEQVCEGALVKLTSCKAGQCRISGEQVIVAVFTNK